MLGEDEPEKLSVAGAQSLESGKSFVTATKVDYGKLWKGQNNTNLYKIRIFTFFINFESGRNFNDPQLYNDEY